MFFAQLLHGKPVSGRPLAVEQTGIADHQDSDADADDDSAFGGLALDPLQRHRIVVAAHGGDDDIVGAIRMLRIELGYCRLRLDA